MPNTNPAANRGGSIKPSASEPREVGGGHRVAAVRTPDGTILGLIDGPERVV